MARELSQVNITAEQQLLLAMQSQSNFAQTAPLNPTKECWNNY